MLRFICGLESDVGKSKLIIRSPFYLQKNTLRERYVELKLLISQKNDELRNLCEAKVKLKNEIIAQDLQEMSMGCKESITKKLQCLKEFVDHPSVYDARYVFAFIKQPLDSYNNPTNNTIGWKTVEYTIEKNRYIEIAITVSRECVRSFVREWLNKNCLKLQHTNYIYPIIL